MSYIERMKNELEELEEKIGKGEDFISGNSFSSLLILDQRLLLAQLSAMEAYSEVLYIRLLRAREVGDV